MLRKTSNHAVKSTAAASVGLLSLVVSLAVAAPASATTATEDSNIEESTVIDEESSILPENDEGTTEGTDEAEEVGSALSDQGEAVEPEEVEEEAVEENPLLLEPGCGIPQANFNGGVGSGVQRIAGATRYETAAEIADAVDSASTSESSAVFIASGANFADGLALGALAAQKGWPLVLTPKNSLDAAAYKTIADAAPTHIYIAGGDGAVTAAVENAALEASGRAAEDVQVLRFAGANRYETAAQIATCFDEGSPAFITTGENFADAVVAGAPAAKASGAIILTPSNKLGKNGQEALSALDPQSVNVIGGKWSGAEQAKIKDAAGVADVAIYSGSDRYATSAKVSDAFYGTGKKPVVFTVGTDFPDALAGVSLSAMAEAPIVLTKTKCRPKAIEKVANNATTKVVLGGSKTVTKASYDSTCKPPPPKPTKTLVSLAKQHVGKAYVGGAAGPNAFDCSGLTQYVYAQMGISIPRTSYAQLASGRRVSTPQPGDIVVLNGGGHVGIYVSPGIMIDAGNPRVGVSMRAIYATPMAYVRFG